MALKGINVNGTSYQMDYEYLANLPTIPSPVTTTTITLTTDWQGGEGYYYQLVTIDGITANTKVDIQPDPLVIAQLMQDGCMMIQAVNESGQAGVIVMGAAPTFEFETQLTLTETE